MKGSKVRARSGSDDESMRDWLIAAVTNNEDRSSELMSLFFMAALVSATDGPTFGTPIERRAQTSTQELATEKSEREPLRN